LEGTTITFHSFKRFSKVLTGNNLGQLALNQTLPSEDEINDLQSKKDNLQKELDELNKVEVKEPEVNSPDKTKPETKEENFFKLESEIVSSLASRRSQSIDSAPGIITVYSDKQIEQLGFQNLGDLIRTIPGMNIDYRPTEIGLIRSRGVPQSILILLDGIPMMQKNVARGFFISPTNPLYL
jgi:outer membrane receptor for Fe3+-dicitrate